MSFRLVDKQPKAVPDRIIGKKSDKGFNTTLTSGKSKCGKDVSVSPAAFKRNINWRRINKEANRHHQAEARFVPVPVLLMNDGTLRIPRQFQAKYLSK